MKAAIINEFGDFDVLKYEEVDTPTPGPGEALVKVLASGINRFDHYIREGSITQDIPLPHILGSDASGEVAEIGEGVTDLRVGDRVIPMPGFPTEPEDYEIYPAGTAPSFTLPGLGIPGTYAQYVVIPTRFLIEDDTGLAPEETASLPVVLSTSVRSVKKVGGVQANDRVLVHAGAGGAGSMQIQVAKALGAQVATTIRNEDKRDFAKSTGADLVINMATDDFVQAVHEWTDGAGADVVIDNLGGDVIAQSIDAVRGGGVVVAFGFTAGTQTTFDIQSFFFGQKQLRGSMASDVEDLRWGLEQVKAGRIKPLVDRALPLSEASSAHRLVAENGVKGSIVLLPWK